MMEQNQPWMAFQRGDRVLVNGRGPNDHSQRGRMGTFIEYVKTGAGYMARISLDPKNDWLDKSEDRWMLHPESLTLLTNPCFPATRGNRA